VTTVVLATHHDGQLRVFTRTNGSGLRPRAVLDVEHAEPELLATLSADLADALGWLPVELAPRPTQRAVAAPEPAELPVSHPVAAQPPRRPARTSAQVEAHRQRLVELVRARPGITTSELGSAGGCSGQQVANMLSRARARGQVRAVTSGPGDPARWYPIERAADA
jgi:hypothetical protein